MHSNILLYISSLFPPLKKDPVWEIFSSLVLLFLLCRKGNGCCRECFFCGFCQGRFTGRAWWSLTGNWETSASGIMWNGEQTERLRWWLFRVRCVLLWLRTPPMEHLGCLLFTLSTLLLSFLLMAKLSPKWFVSWRWNEIFCCSFTTPDLRFFLLSIIKQTIQRLSLRTLFRKQCILEVRQTLLKDYFLCK